MTKIGKLIDKIRNNPKDVRFSEACKVAEMLGFVGTGGKGSHTGFSRPGEPISLNFQDRKGKIPPYQAKQLIQMIERYYDDKQ